MTRKIVEKYIKMDVSFSAINSNSKHNYEEDSFKHMVDVMKTHHFPWIYLYDEKQDIAKKYGALRTPHFYVFDHNRKLVYTGRATDNPRFPEKATTRDLERALDEILAGRKVSVPKTNPIGCNVKWEGKDAHWMPPEACDLV